MKRMICFFLTGILCLFSLQGTGEFAPPDIALEEISAGDTRLLLHVPADLTEVQINAFSREEPLVSDADREGELITLHLLRPLSAGEEILIVIEGRNADGSVFSAQRTASVPDMFSRRLLALQEKAENMVSLWQASWMSGLSEGAVYLPLFWRDYPFALYPDEAPEIRVRQDGNQVSIWLSETLPEGWRVCLARDIPVVYTECVLDPALGVWTGEGEFESVCLICDQTETRMNIIISYEQANSFLPSYPVVEWAQEEGEHFLAMNCYGWGTSRSFQGAMYAIVSEEAGFYAEYGADGFLSSYTEPYLNCVYDASDQLIEGEEPEGWQNPVVH